MIPAVLVAAALAGCGGDDDGVTSSGPARTPTPTATATATATATVTPATTATPTGTPWPTATATPMPSPEKPEEQPGGAGDEEEVRVPVRFKVGAGGVQPPQVSVPAFLALELVVSNRRAQPVVARLEGAESMQVGPGETGHMRLPGRRKGQYVVDFGAAGQGLLVTGVEPGP